MRRETRLLGGSATPDQVIWSISAVILIAAGCFLLLLFTIPAPSDGHALGVVRSTSLVGPWLFWFFCTTGAVALLRAAEVRTACALAAMPIVYITAVFGLLRLLTVVLT